MSPDAHQPRHEHPSLFSEHNGKYGIVGCHPSMKRVYEAIEAVSTTDATVLIRGETGTGKELVARAIHAESGRSGRLVVLNCSAIPEGLLESELFGHVRGAYTGACYSRRGKFEEAHAGTIFLDEIGEMPTATQAKILRALQYKEVTPLGGNYTACLDVRVVAATNSALEEKVRTNTFREDLYYRLASLTISMPALRERKEDIPLLSEYFVQLYNRKLSTELTGLTEDALKALGKGYWKGNVRELEGVIQSAMIWKRHSLHLQNGSARILDAADLANTHYALHSNGMQQEPVQEILVDNFWDSVAGPYSEHMITKAQLEHVIRRGLEQTNGNYRKLLSIFGMPDSDYKKFKDFLRRQQLDVDYREYRKNV